MDSTPDIPFGDAPIAAAPVPEAPEAPEPPRTLSMRRPGDIDARMDTSVSRASGFVPESAPPRRRQILIGLLKAQREIRPVAKDGRNKHHQYDYATSEAVISEARRALLEGGLVARRADHYVLIFAGLPHLISRFELCHPESGETEVFEVPWPIIVLDGRPEDKALGAALTTSFSFWLRDLLLIPKGEGESMDERDDRKFDPSQARGAPAQTGTLGPRGAVHLKQMLRDAKLSVDELRTRVEAHGESMPSDLADWPAALIPRIEQWIAACVDAREKAKRAAPPASTPSEHAAAAGAPA